MLLGVLFSIMFVFFVVKAVQGKILAHRGMEGAEVEARTDWCNIPIGFSIATALYVTIMMIMSLMLFVSHQKMTFFALFLQLGIIVYVVISAFKPTAEKKADENTEVKVATDRVINPAITTDVLNQIKVIIKGLTEGKVQPLIDNGAVDAAIADDVVDVVDSYGHTIRSFIDDNELAQALDVIDVDDGSKHINLDLWRVSVGSIDITAQFELSTSVKVKIVDIKVM